MRKGLVLAVTAVMAVSLFGAVCSFAGEEETVVYDFSTTRTLSTSEVLDFDLTFDTISDAYKDFDAEHKGSDMIIHYTTDAYEDGVTYDKWCRVYLPYGYDSEDTETKYDVIYFNHGNNSSPNDWFKPGHGKTNVFDNIMDPEYGFLEPCIVVCPSYYFYTEEDKWHTPPNTDTSAGDGQCEGIVPNYYKELVEDIIPAVEGQLNTYCEDTSEEGIIASRDHRACGGFSRGGACTWYLFSHDLPYIKYWIPMSGHCLRDTDPLNAAVDPEDSYQYLKEAVEANPDYDFFIFATAGGAKDSACENMARQIKNFLGHEDGIFSYGLDPLKNNFYFTASDSGHSDARFADYLYNIKDVLFNGELARVPSVTEKTVQVSAIPTEEATEKEPVTIPDQYTKIKEFNGTFGFGPAKVTAATNDEENIFFLVFDCFGETQCLEGTVEDGECSVTFDQTGFMTGECQKIWEGALADAGAWTDRE